jgi:hypothetical protein
MNFYLVYFSFLTVLSGSAMTIAWHVGGLG